MPIKKSKPASRALAPTTGSIVEVQHRTRPVKQYAILDTELTLLFGSSLLTTVFGAVSSYFFSYAGSCRLAMAISALTKKQTLMLQSDASWSWWMGMGAAVVAFVFLGFGGSIAYKVRRTSRRIEINP